MRKVFLFVLLFGLIVLAVGVLSVSAYDSVPYGVIGMTSGSKPHDGWVFCNGTNAGLYPGCPNLTGRFVLGYQSGTYSLNATGGATTATLGITNMPSHSHTLPGNIVTAVTTTSGKYMLSAGATSLVTSCVVSTDSNTRAQGSGTAFSIMPPYYVLAYEMKVGTVSNTSLTIVTNAINCVGSDIAKYDSSTGWTVWSNFMRNPLLVDDPNPANGSHQTNYLKKASNITTSLNIDYFNLTGNDTYIYAGGVTTDKIYKYWKDNLTKKAETLSAGGYIFSVCEDLNYVYAGIDTTNQVIRYWKYNMGEKDRSINFGGTVYALAQDSDYVYACIGTLEKVYQLWKSNLTIKAESLAYGGDIASIAEDTNYIYIAGLNTCTVWQIWKSNMTKKAETLSYGANIIALTDDSTYVYCGGKTNKVFQYWKSNMTKKAETLTYGGFIMSLTEDSTYVYAGGATTKKAIQYWKSNMTQKAETVSYGGSIYTMSNDIDFIYVGGQVQKIYKYWKSNMTKNSSESASYGGNIYGISMYDKSAYMDWNRCLNISWMSNSSGSWLQYAHSNLTVSGVVTVPALNFSGIGTYYWKALCESNHNTWFNTSVYSFTTVNPVNTLNFIEHLVNASGGHQQYWNGSAWTIWNNYTGNTTPITLHQNPVHASGTHVYGLNTSGYQVFANYTGDTPSITTYENIVNASGTHQYLWSPSLWKFFVWANYSGNGSAPTPIHLYQNYLNATGTHEYVLNASGYQVWANVTGNNSAFINITKLIPVGSTDAVYKLPLLVGMTVAFPGLLLVKRRRRKNQY